MNTGLTADYGGGCTGLEGAGGGGAAQKRAWQSVLGRAYKSETCFGLLCSPARCVRFVCVRCVCVCVYACVCLCVCVVPALCSVRRQRRKTICQMKTRRKYLARFVRVSCAFIYSASVAQECKQQFLHFNTNTTHWAKGINK